MGELVKHQFTFQNHETKTKAVDFYETVFRATKITHASLPITDVHLNISDSFIAVCTVAEGPPSGQICTIVETLKFDAAVKTLKENKVSDFQLLGHPRRFKFKDPYGYTWMLSEKDAEKCKLCYSHQHLLPLCSNGETLKWIKFHVRHFFDYDNQNLWLLLDKKREILDEREDEFTNKRKHDYNYLKFVSGEPLAMLVAKMKRMIAVFRWAQVAFCVKPKLNGLASTKYENAVITYNMLFSRLPRYENDRAQWFDCTDLWRAAVRSVADLLEWMGVMIKALRRHEPPDQDQEDMDAAITAELGIWKDYAEM